MGGKRRVAPPAPRFEGFTPTSAQASATKRAIKRTDGTAELALRRALWALGLRYRKNVASLPGKPDIVFPKAKVAVFVDGDFWHGRNWEERRAKLKRGANAPYWVAKISANMARDRRKAAELESLGWTVIRVWEGDVHQDAEACARAIAVRSRPEGPAR